MNLDSNLKQCYSKLYGFAFVLSNNPKQQTIIEIQNKIDGIIRLLKCLLKEKYNDPVKFMSEQKQVKQLIKLSTELKKGKYTSYLAQKKTIAKILNSDATTDIDLTENKYYEAILAKIKRGYFVFETLVDDINVIC
jgi:hypothetical protein